MKRLLQSLAGGVLIPALVVAALLLVETLDVHLLERHERIGRAWLFLVTWPMFILSPFPASDSPSPHATVIRLILSLAVILLDVLGYSLLTYALLRWREGRSR